MDNLSLFSRLRTLLELGILTLVADPERHYFAGEGTLKYNGHPISILSDYVGPSPDKSGDRIVIPHDIAWIPALNLILASGKSENIPFVPLKERPTFRDARKKS